MNTHVDKIIQTQHVGSLEYNTKDFKNDVDVRWCSGCGDFAILSQIQKTMPELGIPKEKITFVSGIGCSSRFPYYMDTYGFHSIHGRALAVATGLKISRPDLSIWVPTGDGDCMSIGGNHMIHACRRNIDLNVVMFNNEIYSLTKGQYSPTSKPGQKTKSSPLGALDDPFNPAALALGSGATFVARGIDKDPKSLKDLFMRAAQHKGVSFVEVYTNCVIFNDGAFDGFSDRKVRAEQTVSLEHGKPMVFGANRDKGIKLDGFKPVVVSLTDGKHTMDDLLVHDEKDSTLAFVLANMTYDSSVPRPIGIFQSLDKQSYEEKVSEQIQYEVEHDKNHGNDISSLMQGDDFWTISE